MSAVNMKLPVGVTYKLNPIFIDQYNRPINQVVSAVSFSSSDITKATVDASSGDVTAVSVGTVAITATSGTFSITRNIDVYAPVVSGLVM